MANCALEPLWSVMIPTYNPQFDYLKKALRSVLAEDRGPDRMQIEIVDDCSPDDNVAASVKEIAGDRIEFSRTPGNLGLAGCWNTCIERSRGQWVHILHQDDLVLPGFYSRFEALIRTNPKLEAAFARHIRVDADGHEISRSPLALERAGEMTDFPSRIAVWQCLECASVVVKRSTYERVGGYRNDLPYALDWEMWARIAATGRWGYVPELGAAYRFHAKSETQRLQQVDKTIPDLLRGGRMARAHLPQEIQCQTATAFQNAFATHLLREAGGLFAKDAPKAAGRLLDFFWWEVMKSNCRMNWLLLRLRVLLKQVRQLLSSQRRLMLSGQIH